MAAELLPILHDLYCSHVTEYHGRDNTFNRGSATDKLLRGHIEGRWRVGTYFDPGDGTVTLGVIDLDRVDPRRRPAEEHVERDIRARERQEGVTKVAAITRSPSFSRSPSSTTMTIRPWRISSSTSGMG